jgi:hypothetical protein
MLVENPLPSRETLAVMDLKAMTNLLRWAEYVTMEYCDRCLDAAQRLDERAPDARSRYSRRLQDAADHAGLATRKLQEIESQMIETKQLLSWNIGSKRKLS